jgi:hypothetical protein
MPTQHGAIERGERHGMVNWVVANLGALNALVVDADDLDKAVYVAGVGFYALTAVVPSTIWTAIGAHSTDTLANQSDVAGETATEALNALATSIEDLETSIEAQITAAVDALVGGAPGALDTLNELAAALADDAAFATTVTTALAAKQVTLISGTNIKTVNGVSILGAGDLVAGLSQFTEARNAAAPNDVIPVHGIVPNGAEDDIDIRISPKRYGAILANQPDSTAVGGNKRGLCAIDLQTTRANANQVASGFAATITGGVNNKASGDYSTVAGGTGNSATGSKNTVGGGNNNTAGNEETTVSGGSGNTASGAASTIGGGGGHTASGTYATIGGGSNNTAGANGTVAGGFSNDASGDGDTVGGGYNNTASGARATVAGGFNNIASNGWATVTGGAANTASGFYSTVNGGNNNVANATLAIAEGDEGNTKGRESSLARGNGKFSVSGDAQRVEMEFRGTTTDATPTQIGARGQAVGNASAFYLSDDSCATFQFLVVGRDGVDSGHYIISGAAKKDAAGTAAIIGVVGVTPVESAGAAAWSATVVAFGNGVAVQVTGEAGKTIKWVATMTAVEVVG